MHAAIMNEIDPKIRKQLSEHYKKWQRKKRVHERVEKRKYNKISGYVVCSACKERIKKEDVVKVRGKHVYNNCKKCAQKVIDKYGSLNVYSTLKCVRCKKRFNSDEVVRKLLPSGKVWVCLKCFDEWGTGSAIQNTSE